MKCISAHQEVLNLSRNMKKKYGYLYHLMVKKSIMHTCVVHVYVWVYMCMELALSLSFSSIHCSFTKYRWVRDSFHSSKNCGRKIQPVQWCAILSKIIITWMINEAEECRISLPVSSRLDPPIFSEHHILSIFVIDVF